MKFDAHQFLRKRKPSRSLFIASAIAVLLACLAVFALYRSSGLSSQLTKASSDLAAERLKVKDLTEKLATQGGTAATALSSAQSQCSVDTAVLNGKIAAFAKQAAVCETLRLKIAQR